MIRDTDVSKTACRIQRVLGVWGLLVLGVAVCAESGERRSVAEDLVRELRELERAVDSERGSAGQRSPQLQTPPANADRSAAQGGVPLHPANAGDVSNPAESPREFGTGGTASTTEFEASVITANAGDATTPRETPAEHPVGTEHPAEVVDEAVDAAEDALEEAAERTEEILEENTEQAEERLEEEAEREVEEIEEVTEEAEEEMEDARERTRGKRDKVARGRGPGRYGKSKTKSREERRRDREERRKNRKQGGKKNMMSPEERQQKRATKKQTRSLERLVRFLKKKLELLEEAVPEEHRDDAMFEVIRSLVDQARKLVDEQKGKESTATPGDTTPPAERDNSPGEVTSSTEGDGSDIAGESPSESTPAAARELQELLRMLVNKKL
ncbi:uncharacterized protein [Littorina saxatilis]|uniref:Uncharacterized protein n=1 Tax=Littorina saxatilis TaxID=31220 RepID=A0AAN9BX57_9CAEN